MREIKFRAKRIDTKKWIYGYLMRHKPYTELRTYIKASAETVGQIEWFQVDEETLGGYTGLKDKNGKEIYKGDVIRFKANFTQIERCGIKEGVVEWNEDYARYQFNVKNFTDPFDMKEETDDLSYAWEVIGNIYENPELINS